MKRKLVLGSLAVALPLSFLMTVGAGSASAKTATKHFVPLDAVLYGAVFCDSGHGTLTFNPALTAAGNVPTTVTFTAHLGRCVSTPLAVKAADFVLTGTLPYNNCGQFYNGPRVAPPLVGTESWTPEDWITRFYPGALPLVPSQLAFGAGTYVVPNNALNAKPIFGWVGAVTSGSYVGDTFSLAFTLRKTVQELTRMCTVGTIGSIDFSDYGN